MKKNCFHSKAKKGVLTFEWMVILTVLVIGIVGGVASMRNGLNTKAKDVSGAVTALKCNYTISAAPTKTVTLGSVTTSTSTASGTTY